MSDKLKIYACSGVGNSTDDVKKPFGYEYWLPEGYSELDNTQAANSLLVKINLCRSQLFNLEGLTDEQKTELINSIIFYSLCLSFVCEYSGEPEQLEKVGNAIGVLVAQGAFADPNITLNNGNERIASLTMSVNDLMDNGSDIAPNEEFMNWWVQDVLAYDKFGMNEKKRAKLRKAVEEAAAVSGIGDIDPNWKKDPNLSPYLNKAGEYFLYTYLTDAQVNKLPRIFRTKRVQQQRFLTQCKTLFVRANYGNEKDFYNVLRTSIVGYFKAQPEKVCETIVANGGKVKGVGLTGAEIVAVISAVLSFLGTVLAALLSMLGSSGIAKDTPIDKKATQNAAPNPSDYGADNGSKINKEDDSFMPLLLIGGVAAVAFFLMD